MSSRSGQEPKPTVTESRGVFVSRAVVLGGLAGVLEAQLTLSTGTMPPSEIGFNFALLVATFGSAAWCWTLIRGLPGLRRVQGESILILVAILTFALRGCLFDCGREGRFNPAAPLGIGLISLLLLGAAQRVRPTRVPTDFTLIATAAMTLAALDLAGRDGHPAGSGTLTPVVLTMLVLGLLSSLPLMVKRGWVASLLWTIFLAFTTIFGASLQVRPIRIEPAARKALESKARTEGQPPNLILIVLDTVRADHLSLYGYARKTSPNLDALAAQSLVFDHAISSGNYSLSSHASVFTGLLPGQHGARPRFGKKARSRLERNSTGLSKDVETLASRLHRLGFTTGGASANFVYLAPWTGLQRGFDVFRDPPRRLLAYRPILASLRSVLIAPPPGLRAFGPSGVRQDPEPWDGQSVSAAGSHFAMVAREPFFLFLNYLDAHAPYTPRKGYTFPVDAPGSDAQLIADYDSEIAYLDFAVGELVGALSRASLLDRTILVITADHGEFFGEHGLTQHNRGAYEDVLHVPLLVRYPKGLGPGRIQRPFGLHEVHRLILDLVESRPTDWVDAEDTEPRVLSEVWGRLSSDDSVDRAQGIEPDASVVYMSPFKLINRGAGKNELYDLSQDPREANNLLIRPAENRILRQRMQAAIEKLPPARQGDDPTATEADIDALRALGYIAGETPVKKPGVK